MKALLTAIAAAFLTACNPASNSPNESNSAASKAQTAVSPQPAAKAFAVEEKNDLYEFDFGWPAEAAAVPELDRQFRAEMAKARADLIAGAEDDKANREKQGFDYNPFNSSTQYKTGGQSARLLSLSIESGGYEGGAHGNYGVGELLWDRTARKEIKFAELFAQPANRDRMLTQRWCDALNKAREEKRGEPVAGGGLFEDCPSLDEVAIISTDKDRNGRFERLMLVASPYLAGPWVEGAYEIELGVTAGLIATLKAEFRDSFEAQRPQ